MLEHLLSAGNCATDNDAIKPCIDELKIKPQYPIILVGGTNGKGSVCAYLTNILTHAGYKTGTFTSPHVFRYNERICINNMPIDDDTLANVLHKVIAIAETYDIRLGLFKAFTLVSHLIFQQYKIDIAIVEVGIGGRQDITNLFEPCISAITNVNLDHCELLGNTPEEIGYEKSGIYRSNRPAFYGAANPPRSLVDYARQIHADLELFGQDFGIRRHEYSFDVWCRETNFYSLPYPGLRGDTQPDNAALSLAILSKLRDKFPLSTNSIKTGLLQTTLNGRFQVLPGQPQIILDVAHNPHSVTNMLANMLKLPFAEQSIAVFGVAKDKDAQQIIDLCKDRFNRWFVAKTHGSRGLETDKIKSLLEQAGVAASSITQCPDISDATARAVTETKGRIVCFGSFLVVEESYNTIMRMRK